MDEVDYTRLAAVAMLETGQATMSETAELSGVSRQLVRYWAQMADVDVTGARARFLAKAWREAQRRVR